MCCFIYDLFLIQYNHTNEKKTKKQRGDLLFFQANNVQKEQLKLLR